MAAQRRRVHHEKVFGDAPAPVRSTIAKRAMEMQGFSLIEMMVATAISLVVLSIVLVAVIEGQRSINTIAARTADSNAAQPYMDQMASGYSRSHRSFGALPDHFWDRLVKLHEFGHRGDLRLDAPYLPRGLVRELQRLYV